MELREYKAISISAFSVILFFLSCRKSDVGIRVVKRLISLITLIVQLIFFNFALIAVLMYILFVTFFNLFVFYLQIDVVGTLLLNASLLLVLTTDYSD